MHSGSRMSQFAPFPISPINMGGFPAPVRRAHSGELLLASESKRAEMQAEIDAILLDDSTSCKDADDFVTDYPGKNFGKTEPIRKSRKIANYPDGTKSKQPVQSAKIRPKEVPVQPLHKARPGKSDEVQYISCEADCSCQRQRPAEFYDIFLASSVKESDEYRELLQRREVEQRAATQPEVADEEACAEIQDEERWRAREVASSHSLRRYGMETFESESSVLPASNSDDESFDALRLESTDDMIGMDLPHASTFVSAASKITPITGKQEKCLQKLAHDRRKGSLPKDTDSAMADASYVETSWMNKGAWQITPLNSTSRRQESRMMMKRPTDSGYNADPIARPDSPEVLLRHMVCQEVSIEQDLVITDLDGEEEKIIDTREMIRDLRLRHLRNKSAVPRLSLTRKIAWAKETEKDALERGRSGWLYY